jgi:putative ABC transport system permease protein
MSSPGERLFLLLIHLYPREFRERYRQDLVTFFGQDRRHPKYGSGVLRPVRFWASTLVDLVRAALAQRIEGRRLTRPTMSALALDVRNAWRSLRSSPAITATALILLTIGVGAGTAIFSAVDAIVLRSLPFDAADRLVSVAETDLDTGDPITAAPQNFFEWTVRQDVFEALGASASAGSLTTTDTDRPERLRAQRVTANLFDVLRVAPALGRGFTPANEIRGNHRVALISDALWRSRFNGDPGVIGRVIRFETGTLEVAGVMPRGFTYPIGSDLVSAVDLWIPYSPGPPERDRGAGRTYNLHVVGRLMPGVSLQHAAAQMSQIRNALALEHPTWFVDRGISVRLLQDAVVPREVRAWMLMLLAGVAGVLLIACVNVANLLLARASDRSREIGVRAAMGATRAHIVRGILVESLVLSLAGAAGGLLVAYWSVDVLKATLPADLPRLWTVAVDFRVAAIASIVSVVCGMLCGLVPALQLSGGDVLAVLRSGGRMVTGGRARQHVRTALLITEVALATVLLIGAGFFVSSLTRLMNVDLGFDPANVLAVSVFPKQSRIEGEAPADADARVQSVVLQALDRARAIPGVQSAALVAGGLPLSGSYMTHPVKIPERAAVFDREQSADLRAVSPDYLATIGGTQVSGRFISDTDTRGAPAVVVLSDEAVRRYFGGGDPIGAVVLLEVPRTVIGVVRGMRIHGPEVEIRPEAYIPFPQSRQPGADLVLRTGPDPLTIAPAVKSAVWSVLPTTVIPEPETFGELYAGLIAMRRFNVVLLGLFGGLALLIASVGIYGVMAYLVEQRRREIGVRMALGALPRRILTMILGRAALTSGIGLFLGVAGAIWLERLLTPFLFRPTPRDPAVYGSTALLLMLLALVAALLPARRAARVDPLLALRSE